MNKVYAVGLGPGNEEFFTGQARAAIEKSDVICGYTVYVDLVRDIFPDKEFFTTSMKQEIDRCTERVHGMDQPEELARLTGMHSTFAKAIPYKGGEYGVMLLSRNKPLSVAKIPLPGREPRVLLMCEFEDCVVCTTHLAVDSQKARSDSVAIIRKAIASFSSGKDKPVFISGDWNSLPDSDVLKELEKFLTVVSDIGGRTFHGSSGAGPRDLNGKRPESYCIDYIAVDSAHALQFKASDARVVEERKASDHAPIVVTVTRSK